MIHHVSVGTNDLPTAKAFYGPVLTTVGLALMEETGSALIYGGAAFEFSIVVSVDGFPASAGNGVHVAFGVGKRAMVDSFHRRALEHGGSSEGGPGLRPDYNGNYYGAFVLDPDGNKIEAVTYSAD